MKPSHKILVADDHAIMRRTLASVLSECLDAEITLACDGEEALQFLRDGPEFELAILDISMPGKTGLEVLREIRPERRATAFVVISAHSEDAYAERARRLGADAFIPKESIGEELVPCVRLLLNGAEKA